MILDKTSSLFLESRQATLRLPCIYWSDLEFRKIIFVISRIMLMVVKDVAVMHPQQRLRICPPHEVGFGDGAVAKERCLRWPLLLLCRYHTLHSPHVHIVYMHIFISVSVFCILVLLHIFISYIFEYYFKNKSLNFPLNS